MNDAYCATASGVGADSAAPVGSAVTRAAILAGACAVVARADFFGAAFLTAPLVGAFLTVFFAFAVGAFAAIFLTAIFFRATFFGVAFLAAAGCVVFVAPVDSARTRAQRALVAAMIAFLPAADSFRFGFSGSGVGFDFGLECSTGGFLAVPEDACRLTASFARLTAAFAS